MADEGPPRHDVPLGGRSGFALVDERQVHYLEWGASTAPPVLCLHGGGQTAYMWEEFGYEQAALVGASLGGIVSLTLAAAEPGSASAIALIDIGHRLEDEGVNRI